MAHSRWFAYAFRRAAQYAKYVYSHQNHTMHPSGTVPRCTAFGTAVQCGAANGTASGIDLPRVQLPGALHDNKSIQQIFQNHRHSLT